MSKIYEHTLKYLSLLAGDECCVRDLAERLAMTESAISHRLRSSGRSGSSATAKEGGGCFTACTTITRGQQHLLRFSNDSYQRI